MTERSRTDRAGRGWSRSRCSRRGQSRRGGERQRGHRRGRRRAITTNGPMLTSTPIERIGGQRRSTGAHQACGMIVRGEQLERLREGEIGVGGAERGHRAARPTRSPTMTADARVVSSAAAYLGLAKKLTSPGPGRSSPAMPVISMAPSPSRRQPRRSASSRSLTVTAGKARACAQDRHRGAPFSSRARNRQPIEERGEPFQP